MSRSAAVRAQAARILAHVVNEGRSLDPLLAADHAESVQERGLLRSLCYDSVRWYVRLDALLAQLLRKGQQLEPELHALCIVGLCQLLHTSIPPHAVVDETVNAARLIGQPRAAGLVNAVLRRCQREGGKFCETLDRDLAIRTAHPQWLVSALRNDWPLEVEKLLEANNERPPFWLRVNARKITGIDYRARLEAAGFEVTQSRNGGFALLLSRATDVSELPGFAEGLVSVQDAAAQCAAYVLAPRRGERILDACAAPGGKTCHLLELEPHIGELVALDVSKERLSRVRENLDRLGLAATVMAADAADPPSWWDGRPFDRILLDVPCSATGVIRRHPDIKLLRRREDIASLVQRQAELLAKLWPLLKPGGQLLYASCSMLKAETSQVVSAFMQSTVPIRDCTADGIKTLSLEPRPGAAVGHAIATGTAGMDGFYYARLEKPEG